MGRLPEKPRYLIYNFFRMCTHAIDNWYVKISNSDKFPVQLKASTMFLEFVHTGALILIQKTWKKLSLFRKSLKKYICQQLIELDANADPAALGWEMLSHLLEDMSDTDGSDKFTLQRCCTKDLKNCTAVAV